MNNINIPNISRFPRRDFLRIGAAGLLGLGSFDRAKSNGFAAIESVAPAQSCGSAILIWLSGGPSTIDMWDPKPHAPESIRGDFTTIDSAIPGVRVCEHLPQLARTLDRFTLIRSLTHEITAHDVGSVYIATGNRPSQAIEHPAIGALTARIVGPRSGIPPYIIINQLKDGVIDRAGYLGSAAGAFAIEGSPLRNALRAQGNSLPTDFSLSALGDRERLLKRFDRGLKGLDETDIGSGLSDFQRRAIDILRSDRVRRAIDLSNENPTTLERYGSTELGRGALAARRLIEAGVRFVTLGFGGWDTHTANFEALRTNLLPTIDRALSALALDLESRGLLDDTLIYCLGEFGRTPIVNASAGRDHWSRTMSVLLAGGGFRRGYVHGATDDRCSAPTRDACSPDDLAATIVSAFGIDPHAAVASATSRPIVPFRDGKTIDKLFD